MIWSFYYTTKVLKFQAGTRFKWPHENQAMQGLLILIRVAMLLCGLGLWLPQMVKLYAMSFSPSKKTLREDDSGLYDKILSWIIYICLILALLYIVYQIIHWVNYHKHMIISTFTRTFVQYILGTQRCIRIYKCNYEHEENTDQM